MDPEDAERAAWWDAWEARTREAPVWEEPVPFQQLARWIADRSGDGKANEIGSLFEQVERARQSAVDPVRCLLLLLVEVRRAFPEEWAVLMSGQSNGRSVCTGNGARQNGREWTAP